MTIENFVPENMVLKELVECFFIIEHLEDDSHERFLILPSVDTYLSVSLNTISFSENGIVVTQGGGTGKATIDAVIQTGLKSPCIYEYRGRVKEVCIRFKPLGAWSFFYHYLPAAPGPFIPTEQYEGIFRQILTLEDNSEIFKQIEQFLGAIHRPFAHPYLPSVMEALKVVDADAKINIDAISKLYNISRQALTSQFKKYLALSPSEFRQILRFRKFVETKLMDENNSSLTALVYDTGFFDQSHLIKYFRKYSFLHPLEFFRKVNFSDNKKVLLIWQ